MSRPGRMSSGNLTSMHAVLKGAVVLALAGVAAALSAPAPVRQISAERHLRNVRQLTFGGENAEAYFSADGRSLIFESTRDGNPCDQIYTMRVDGGDLRRVSTGAGRTTCGYFYPGGKEILFASTHRAGAACPQKPCYEHGYVWPIYEGYDIYRAN